MEQQVIFRQYQEQTEEDHNNLQSYTRDSIDHVVADFCTGARRFAGFNVTKSGQVELTITTGRITDNAGAVFAKRTPTSESLSLYTAGAAKVIVSVSAYPFEDQNGTNDESRDYLVDVANDITEPKQVSMTRSRDAVLVFTAGQEGADPKAPPLPTNHVEIARVLLDTTQIVSVTMIEANRAVSAEALSLRAAILEAFKTQIEPRVTSLAADLAGLQSRVDDGATKENLAVLRSELARVNTTLRLPGTQLDAFFNPFLTPFKSDTLNTSNLGWDAKINEGVRFPDANAADFLIDLFSANDPNASVNNGLLLPKYTEQNKLYTGGFDSEIGIAQYGFQTVEMKQGYMSRSRLRYGGSQAECSNGVYWASDGQPANAAGLFDFGTTAFSAVTDISYNVHGNGDGAQSNRTDFWWYDTWKEPYMYAVTVPHNIQGAQIAQSFLISNDFWATSLEFYVTAKAANEDIHVAICELTSGVPDLSRTILKTVYAHAGIVAGWNKLPITPTFFKKGSRYAAVYVSNANHKFGMTSGQNYLDGTFFYSTDRVYYQGDLTKDLMMKVNGALFNSSQVAIEFKGLNLDGGFRHIDIMANMWVPDSCQLIFEVRVGGTGAWLPLTQDVSDALATAPVLAQFRARFIGTTGVAPAIQLGGDGRVRLSRPKTAFRHISDLKVLTTPSDEIHVETLVEGFDPSNGLNTLTGRIYVPGVGYKTPTTTRIEKKDDKAKRYLYKYTYALAANASSFYLVDDGATTSALRTYHIATQSAYSM